MYVLLIMFAYKSTSYEKVEKPKPDNKFRKNSYEEIKKLVEDGDEMQLKETIKTRKDNHKNVNKIKFNLFEFIIKNNNSLILFIYYGNFCARGYTH